MTMKWNASKFHDEYREALMKLVQKKIKPGKTEEIEDVEEEEAPFARRSTSWTFSRRASSMPRKAGQSRPRTTKTQRYRAAAGAHEEASGLTRHFSPFDRLRLTAHESQRIQTQTRLQENAGASRRQS